MSDDERSSPNRRRFRFRFSLRQLFIAVALVAVGLGAWKWLTRRVVAIRAPTPQDRVFGDESLKNRRNAASATGRFQKGTASWLKVSVHVVQSGAVAEASSHLIYRNEKILGGSKWEHMELKFALGESDVPGGWVTELAIAGHAKDVLEVAVSSGGVNDKHNIKFVVSETLDGEITPGRPHIVYVEGDQKFVVDRKMTVEEFAARNSGNYLVLSVEFR